MRTNRLLRATLALVLPGLLTTAAKAVVLAPPVPPLLDTWGTHTPANGLGSLFTPRALATAADGSIWVVEQQSQRLQHFTAAGRALSLLGSAGDAEGQFNSPTGLAIDAAGFLYVVDQGRKPAASIASPEIGRAHV